VQRGSSFETATSRPPQDEGGAFETGFKRVWIADFAETLLEY